MKIIDLEKFLAMPEGTVYAKSEGTFNFQSLHVKGETFGEHGDWWYFDPCCINADDGGHEWDRMQEMLDYGTSYPMEDAVSRDGLYDKDSLFLVFEREDLLRLQAMLNVAISVSAT